MDANQVHEVTVTLSSGYMYADRPLGFNWAGVQYVVDKIEKSWLDDGGKYFIVRVKDGRKFELCYNQATQKWTARLA